MVDYAALEEPTTKKRSPLMIVAAVVSGVLIVGLAIACIVLAVALNAANDDKGDAGGSPSKLDATTMARVTSFMGDADPCDGS